MATEEGIVIKLPSSSTALVKTIRSSACKSCSSKKSCHTADGGQEMEVETINALNARAGDTVVIEFKTGSLLKASFLIHVFPILCLLAGAIVGQEIASEINFDPSGASALVGFSFFVIAILLVRMRSEKMAQKDEYKPNIIRIKKRATAGSLRPAQ